MAVATHTPASDPTKVAELTQTFAARRPRPILDSQRERLLTPRQRELLDLLGAIVSVEGFADFTMADLAARLNCSLRTLYGLAASRDELVLTILDRHLQRAGQHALGAITAEMESLSAIRAFLSAVTDAVSETSEAFARDLADLPAGQRLNADHTDFAVAVTEALLELGVRRGEIRDVDTAAVARLMAGLASRFTQPEAISHLRGSPKAAADEVMDLLLRGLDRSATGS